MGRCVRRANEWPGLLSQYAAGAGITSVSRSEVARDAGITSVSRSEVVGKVVRSETEFYLPLSPVIHWTGGTDPWRERDREGERERGRERQRERGERGDREEREGEKDRDRQRERGWQCEPQ